MSKDRQEYAAAKKAQAQLQARQKATRIRHETAAYRKANARTAAAAARLPWWKR